MNRRLRKRILVYLLLTLCTFLLALTTGCGISNYGPDAQEESGTASQDEKESIELFAMDTYMILTAYGPNAGEGLEAARAEIERIENLLSTGIETSEIALLNEKGRYQVSQETSDLIQTSIEISQMTAGRFDISIYPLMEAWGFPDQNYRVPEKKEIKELLKLVDYENIIIGTDNTISFKKEGMKIDLGGIAKGYTSQRVMEILQEKGVDHAVISLGGNVQTLGKKPDGSLWKVGIENPGSDDGYFGTLRVEDKAVITSGNYERYFEKDGKRYHHILSPLTGRPADHGVSSVTIVSDNGSLADGLSTALFVMKPESAVAFWREHSDAFDMIIGYEDGRVLVTEGLKDSFESDLDWELLQW